MRTASRRISVSPLRPAVLCLALAVLLLPAGPVQASYSVRPVCRPPAPGRASCDALELVPGPGAQGADPRTPVAKPTAPLLAGGALAVCEHGLPTEGCQGLRPQDLHTAYELPPTAPAGEPQTIAIVDPFDDPTAEADLKEYSATFGLPQCTHARRCFSKINQEGRGEPLPEPSGGAAAEISLDIETAHAICEDCHILLVEANSFSEQDLEAAENRAVTEGANEISNSWYGKEPATDGPAFDHPGVVITAAAGDFGYLSWGSDVADEKDIAPYPASSPDVIGVGGTHLALEPATGAWQSEVVWNGEGAGGSGCSEHFSAPPWQTALAGWPAVGCADKRAVADVAADGDISTPVAIYDSTPGPEGNRAVWRRMGGTSFGSPLIAAAFALAGGAHGVEYPARTLYENAVLNHGSLHDITAGSNGECHQGVDREGFARCTTAAEAATCTGAAICLAGTGYDGPTGVGTPNGLGAFEPVTPSGTPQTLAFDTSPPLAARVGGTAYTVGATSTSAMNPFYTSATPSICALAGTTVSFLEVGTCTIAANQPGDATYAPAPQARQSFQVHKGNQAIRFSSRAPRSATAGGETYTVLAVASSGLPVSYSSATPTVCALAGTTVSFLAAGTCTIDADQEGDHDYWPAPEAQQSFTVAVAPPKRQSIEFTSPAPEHAVVGGAGYEVAAAASSGLPVTLSIVTPEVCVLSGSSVGFIAAGTCTIAANQGGDAEYLAAPGVVQSFVVLAPQPVPLISGPPPASGTLSFISSSPAPRPEPDSNFSLTSKPAVNRRTGTIRFSAALANPGTLVWSISFRDARGRRIIFAHGAVSAAAAGTVAFTARPPAALGARALARSRPHGLLLTATLTFRSSLGGQATTHTSRIAYLPARTAGRP